MSKPPSSPLGPFGDRQKQPLDLTDSNSRLFAVGKMRRPSCSQWNRPGWYLTLDTSVLKAQLAVMLLGGCLALYKKGGGKKSRCVTSPLISAWLASLWQPCFCVCVWAHTICMSVPSPTAPPIYLEGKPKPERREKKKTHKNINGLLTLSHE